MEIQHIGRTKPRSLTVAFFNANGIRDQKEEIMYFLRDHDIDIMLVQETFLKPSLRDPKIANYTLVRNDRLTGPKGGTLIYYKRSLQCVPIDTPPLTNLEASVCRIALTGHPPITIASAYLSPLKSILDTDISALLNLGPCVLIAGDLNSKHVSWNSNVNNSNGIILRDLTERLNFDVIAPESPTRYPFADSHHPDVLDIALLKDIRLNINSIEVIIELVSDHRPVVLQLGQPAGEVPMTKTIVDWRKLEVKLKSTNSQYLDTIPDKIDSLEEADRAISALSTHLTSAVEECSRKVRVSSDQHTRLPADVRRLIRAKNSALKTYDRYRTIANKLRVRSLQNEIKQRVSEFRNDRWDNLLVDIEPSQDAFWKLSRALKADKSSPMPPLVRLDHPDLALDDLEKAECLADSLEYQCTPSTAPTDPAHLLEVEAEVVRRSALPPAGEPLDPVTVDEVTETIKSLKNKSAPGPDGISNKVIKSLSAPLIYLLVGIFNTFLTNCSFPDIWKEADVIGIPKPGKPRNRPSSYRPISLLNTLGKLYERIIHKRLRHYTESNRLLPDEQFGFRAHHSCTHQIHRLTEYILSGFNQSPTKRKSRNTGALFFDVAKAFDKVWHDGLIYKLYKLNVPDRLVHIIRAFLSNRSFRYRVEGTRSSKRFLKAGVPQGSVLSPLLFTLFTSDIPKDPVVNTALFADDTALYVSDYNKNSLSLKLQKATNRLGEWFRLWRIDVNPEKSVAVYFQRNSTSRSKPKTISLYDRPIPWEESAKYLGVTFDNRMSFAKHISAVRNKARSVIGRLHPLVNSKSKLSLRHKLRLYKTCVRPIMSYASVAFAHTYKSHILKLQRVQNLFIRKATGARWYQRNSDLHNDCELPSISEYFKEMSERYFDKVETHPNPLVANAANYIPIPNVAPYLRRPRNILIEQPQSLDPVDLSVAGTTHNATTPTLNVTNTIRTTNGARRTRRRARRVPAHTAYTPYTRVPGRFSPPIPSTDTS